jgi:Protein of unknown function (DUF1549)/Protein of unknown function (DUF1553)
MTRHRMGFVAVFVFIWAATLSAGAGDDAQKLADRIDELIGAKLRDANIEPALPADDATFYRRLSLDLTGKTPASAEARTFLSDTRQGKRRQAIDRQLDGAGYGIHFANVWAGLMLPEIDDGFQKQALVASLSRWVRQQLDENVAYDKWVRDIVAFPLENNPEGGGNDIFNNTGPMTPTAFYQSKMGKPENIAASVVRVFLGVRIECAQCHDHPFAPWKRDQFWGQAAFFAGVRRPASQMGDFFIGTPLMELKDRRELIIPGTDRVAQPVFLDGKEPQWKYQASARATFADWMTAKENPFFAHTAVNRLWGQLFGIGIVEPVDDFSTENKPSHPELLDELAKQFAEHGFDLKFIVRAICLSKTYQQSSVYPGPSKPETRLFAYMPVKGLSADQIYDSLIQATGNRDNSRGNSNRFAAINSPKSTFQQKFAPQEKRTEFQTSIPQALALMNNPLIATETHPEKGDTLAAIASAPFLDTAGKIEALYLAALSRRPTEQESCRLVSYLDKSGNDREKKKALSDIFWALLNSPEFLFNH